MNYHILKFRNGAKSIFGEDFSKEFNKEGTDDIVYNPENDMYYATSIELDEEEDRFIIDSINKNKNEYEVEIIEYLEDYTDTLNLEDGEVGSVHVKNFDNEVVFDVQSNESESAVIDLIKENRDKFSGKFLTLSRNKDGDVFVKNVKK